MLGMLAEAAQRLRKAPQVHNEPTTAPATDDATASVPYTHRSDDGCSTSVAITPHAEQLFEGALNGTESPAPTAGSVRSVFSNPFDVGNVAVEGDDSATESVDVSIDEVQTGDGTQRRDTAATVAEIRTIPRPPSTHVVRPIPRIPSSQSNTAQLRSHGSFRSTAARNDLNATEDKQRKGDVLEFDEHNASHLPAEDDDYDFGGDDGNHLDLNYTGVSPFKQLPRYMAHTARSSRHFGFTIDVHDEPPASPVVPQASKLQRLKMLMKEMSVIFKECDAGKKGYLSYAEFGLFLCRAGLLKDIGQLRHNSLCALSVNLAKHIGQHMTDLSSTFWNINDELDACTGRTRSLRNNKLLQSGTLGRSMVETPAFRYTMQPPEKQPSRLVRFPLVEAGITIQEAVGLIMVVSDTEFSDRLLGTHLGHKIVTKSLCKYGTVQEYAMTIGDILQTLRADWSRRTKLSRSLTFEQVYPDYTFRPTINERSLELCTELRQSLYTAWKAQGCQEHFALFCIKENFSRTQRRLDELRSTSNQQFSATFQTAPTVNPESESLAAAYRARFKELYDLPAHQRLHQEFTLRSEKLDTLRNTYQAHREELDREVYTFWPKLGPMPAVASSRSQQLSQTQCGQLVLEDLPLPTGYYEEIQRIKDNYERRVKRLMLEKSLQMREYPDERTSSSPGTLTQVQEFQFSTAQRCAQRVERVKQERFAASISSDNGDSEHVGSPITTPMHARKAVRTDRPASAPTYKTPRTAMTRASVATQNSQSHINKFHMQIKLGPRKVVTFYLREGEDIEDAVDRFLRTHGLPEAVREVLYKRAERKLKSNIKQGLYHDGQDSPRRIVTEDVDFETVRRSKRREQLRRLQHDKERQWEDAKNEAWKQYKKRLHEQAVQTAHLAYIDQTPPPTPEGPTRLRASKISDGNGVLPFSPIKHHHKKYGASSNGTAAVSVMVNIDDNNTARLELLDGEDPFNAARRFCIQHGIEYNMYPKLAQTILKEQRKSRRTA